MTHEFTSTQKIRVANDLDAVYDLFCERGWSDGLPIMPPTEERVQKMLAGTARRPDEVVARLAPSMADATVESIAVNSVMAGCRPEYLPVVIAGVEAVAEEEFNLLSVQTTTYPCAPLMIINGPIRQALGINSGTGAFGPGTRANAAIGRALRLTLVNVGGASPGAISKDTHAHPGKYTYCVGENEEENPWEPLHVELGFPADLSTVSVAAADAPHSIGDHANNTAVGILTVMADGMSHIGLNQLYFSSSPMLLFLCPEHSHHISKEGWSKKDAKNFIFEKARVPLSKAKIGAAYWQRHWPKWFETSDDALIPMASDPDDIYIMVAGGEGTHSAFVPTLGTSMLVTKAIQDSKLI